MEAPQRVILNFVSDASPATRVTVFLTEDDRFQHRSAAEVLLERAKDAGMAGATVVRGIEGFGASGVLRTSRLPDLARGLPLVFELIDTKKRVDEFVAQIHEVAGRSLVTIEEVTIDRPSS